MDFIKINVTFVNQNLNYEIMNKRLEQFMKAEGLTSAKLAEILSVQPSSISHLLAGRNKPNFDFISNLLSMFPHLNIKWIINGDGDMYLGEKEKLQSPKGYENIDVTNVTNRDSKESHGFHNTTSNKEFKVITDVTTYGSSEEDYEQINQEYTNVNNTIPPQNTDSLVLSDLKDVMLSELSKILVSQINEVKASISEELSNLALLNSDTVNSNVTPNPVLNNEINCTHAVSEKLINVDNNCSTNQLHPDSQLHATVSTEAKKLTQVMLFYSDGTFETLSK